MRLFNIFLVIVPIILSSCSEQGGFTRNDEIIAYLLQEHNIRFENYPAIIVILSGGCGSCDEDTKEIIKELGQLKRFQHFKKILVIPNQKRKYLLELQESGFEILNADYYDLASYGLNFEKNLIIQYSEKMEIVYWEWLYMEIVYDVLKHYMLK